MPAACKVFCASCVSRRAHGLAAGAAEEAATGGLRFGPLVAVLTWLAQQRPTRLTPPQRAALARLLTLLTTQAADCRAEARGSASTMEDLTMLVVQILPNWLDVLCPGGGIGAGRSVAGGQSETQAEGVPSVEEGLVALLIRLQAGLAGLLFCFCQGVGPDRTGQRVMADVTMATTQCPEVIQGGWKGAGKNLAARWLLPPARDACLLLRLPVLVITSWTATEARAG